MRSLCCRIESSSWRSLQCGSATVRFLQAACGGWLVGALLMAFLLMALSGCSRQPAQFEPNRVYMRHQKLAERADDFQTERLQRRVQDVMHVLTFFFGTPDEPNFPDIEGLPLGDHLQLNLLQMAAGSANQSRPGAPRGLYRSHCARCHGITGDGAGPMAGQLDPYPRDYRRGIFKFKRTPSTLPPTRDDLHNVLMGGVSGTDMPAFRELTRVQREALVQYVEYLSIRGALERALIEEAAFQLDEDELLLDPNLERTSSTLHADQLAVLNDIASEVIQPWLEADQQVLEVTLPPDDLNSPDSIARGRELFFTTLTNCATCHGATALGDGQTEDYDEWAKELEPSNADTLSQYLSLGALPPRTTQPRNLRDGIYRGGFRPEELFVRIKHGIAGTTMPNVATQLTDRDIWHLVAYAQYLPFDPLSHPTPLPADDTSEGTPQSPTDPTDRNASGSDADRP